MCMGAVKTRIIGPCARTLELPLLVKSGVFYFYFSSWGACFLVFPTPFPEKEILDDLAHGPIVQVLTVISVPALQCKINACELRSKVANKVEWFG